MLKKVCNLTLNEILKQYKKKSICVFTIIIFLVAIGFPFFVRWTTNNINNLYLEGSRMNLYGINSQIASANTKTDSGKIKKEFLQSEKNEADLLINCKVGPNDWRNEEGVNYLEGLLKVDTLNLLKQGINGEMIVGELPQTVNPENFKELLTIPKDTIDSKIKDINKENEKIKSSIVNNDYLSYLKKNIDNSNKQIDTLNKNVKTLNTEFNKDKNNLLLKHTIDNLNSEIKLETNLLNVTKYRYDNKIPFDQTNWKSETLNNLKESINLASLKPQSENEYNSATNDGQSYKEYKEHIDKKIDKANDQIKVDWYSLKNNIPQADLQIAAKSATNSSIPLFIVIITIFAAILAGGIVSTEFSKGTIRLLMLRPVTRCKILLSKILGVGIISYAILFISMILSIITSGCIFGFSDFKYSLLKVSSGAVVEHNYILNLIGHTLFLSISLIFIVSIAFLLSTLVRSTALSVAVSIILFIGSFPVTLILLGKKYLWVAMTPIPYINLPFVPSIQGFFSTINLNADKGAIELLIISIILFIISFVYFKKADVTN